MHRLAGLVLAFAFLNGALVCADPVAAEAEETTVHAEAPAAEVHEAPVREVTPPFRPHIYGGNMPPEVEAAAYDSGLSNHRPPGHSSGLSVAEEYAAYQSGLTTRNPFAPTCDAYRHLLGR